MLTPENTHWYCDYPGLLELSFGDVAGPWAGHGSTSFGQVHLWIQQRPHYCDRGHYQMDVTCFAMGLDHADMFPRYYFDLETAKAEAIRFLNWRLWRVK